MSAGSRAGLAYWGALAAIGAGGAALRCWYVLHVVMPIQCICDPWAYFTLGSHLATGVGYLRPAEMAIYGQAVPTAEFPPLFPAIVAMLRLLGVDSLEAQRPIVAMLGVATVPLVAEIARSVAGRAAGLLAGLLAALSPTLVESDGAFMAEVISVPLVASSLLVAVSAGRRAGRWAIVGLLVGLSALARAEGLLLVPLLLPGLLWANGPEPWRRSLAQIGALAAGAALVVIPWSIRNYTAVGAFVPVSSSVDTAILGANCDETYDGALLGSWTFRCYERVPSEGLSEAERSRRYRRAGLEFMRDHASSLPLVMAARLGRTFGPYQPGSWDHGLSEGRSDTWTASALRVGAGVLLVAIGGAVLLARRSPAATALLCAPVLLACLTSVLVYGNPRFRLCAEPSLLVLAAYAVLRVAAGLRSRSAGS